MIRFALYFFISLGFCHFLYAQEKKILGDTLYYFKNHQKDIVEFQLKDFSKSSDEFNFRFRNFGQYVEITKNGKKYSGVILNYIHHTKRKKSNTITQRIEIDSTQVKDLYNWIKLSEILDIPTDKEIENWEHGVDGITYFIEHTDSTKYYYKNYWTPTSQDSLAEALRVENFVNGMNEKLNLKEVYQNFKKTLPKQGCYSNGSFSSYCMISNSLWLGYNGSLKMPYGFHASTGVIYLGNFKINGGILADYFFDGKDSKYLNLQASKWNIIFRENNFSDFAAYNFQYRNIPDERIFDYKNHQFRYGLHIGKTIGLGGGIDFLEGNHQKLAPLFYATKNFNKVGISTNLKTSFFENSTNLRINASKSFYFHKTLPFHSILIGMAYEDYFNYKDLYLSLEFSF